MREIISEGSVLKVRIQSTPIVKSVQFGTEKLLVQRSRRDVSRLNVEETGTLERKSFPG